MISVHAGERKLKFDTSRYKKVVRQSDKECTLRQWFETKTYYLDK